MIIYRNPKRTQWGEITSRPRLDLAQLNETVSTVLNDVRQRGDEAVKDAEDKKYVRMNAPKAHLEEIISVLPGLKSLQPRSLKVRKWRHSQASAVGRKVSPLSV